MRGIGVQRAALKVGIVGMGTIGRAIAQAIDARSMPVRLTAVYSRTEATARQFLATLVDVPPFVDLPTLITQSDLVIEAAGQTALSQIAPLALNAGKDLMVISVGALLEHAEWADLARQKGCRLYVPSGAIVGLDGVKGASMGRIESVTINSRKPPKGLAGAPYVVAQGLDVFSYTEETLIFEGSARDACKGFPDNVNVSAALSLAGIGPDSTRIRIFVVPHGTHNVHDIEVIGEFGRMTTHIENVPSDTNPRTGKLSYLSALAMLRDLTRAVHYGT